MLSGTQYATWPSMVTFKDLMVVLVTQGKRGRSRNQGHLENVIPQNTSNYDLNLKDEKIVVLAMICIGM